MNNSMNNKMNHALSSTSLYELKQSFQDKDLTHNSYNIGSITNIIEFRNNYNK